MTAIGASGALRIRLIEPPAPSVHMWSYSHYPRLGLPIIGAALKAAGPRRAHLRPATDARADWRDVDRRRSGRHLDDHLHRARRLRRSPTPCARAAYPWCSAARTSPSSPMRRSSTPTTSARGEGGDSADARAHRRACRAARPGEHRRPVVRRGDGPHPQRGARALRRPRRRARARPLADRRRRPARHAHHDELGLPLRLQLLLGHGHVRPQGADAAASDSVIAELRDKRPSSISFYDDNFAADKARAQGAAARHDRARRRRPLAGAGAHRRGARRRAARPHATLRLPHAGARSGIRSTRRRWTPSRSRRPWRTWRRPSTPLHEYGIDVHGMFVMGADSDTAETGAETVEFALDHSIDTRDAQRAHARARHRAVRAHGRGRPHLRQELAALRRPARGVHAPPDDARSSCSARSCAATAASSPRAAGIARTVGRRFDRLPVDSWCWWYARCWHSTRTTAPTCASSTGCRGAARPAAAVPQRKIA